MSANNVQIVNGRRTKYVPNFGKSTQCKFCKFEWLVGDQALNIHEKLCQENQVLKKKVQESRDENLRLEVDNSTLCEQNAQLKGDLEWIVYGK